MSDAHWTSYIGMITGAAGAVMGFLGLQRANTIKKLDMRVELRRELNAINLAMNGLSEFLADVSESHRRVMAMRGLNGSGAWAIWEQEHAASVTELEALIQQQPRPENYTALSAEELEEQLIAADLFRGRAERLREKYRAIVADDDVHRAEARGAVRR